jgi:hypothetical protein
MVGASDPSRSSPELIRVICETAPSKNACKSVTSPLNRLLDEANKARLRAENNDQNRTKSDGNILRQLFLKRNLFLEAIKTRWNQGGNSSIASTEIVTFNESHQVQVFYKKRIGPPCLCNVNKHRKNLVGVGDFFLNRAIADLRWILTRLCSRKRKNVLITDC